MRTKQLFRRTFVALGLLVAGAASPARAATAEQIDAATTKAKAYLYAKLEDGNLEIPEPAMPARHYETGGHAIVLYSLLASGESASDPRIAKAIEWQLGNKAQNVYALAVRMQIWTRLKQTPPIRDAIKRDAAILLGGMKTTGDIAGCWDYFQNDSKDVSFSRTQYAVLGLWAAQQADLEISDKTWQTIENAWLKHQDPSGAWSYRLVPSQGYPLTPGITAAAVASLYLTQDALHGNEGINCKGGLGNPAIDKGLDWLAGKMNLVATDAPYARDFPYPTLYTLERVGMASGRKYFGAVDWYQKGADWLVKRQSPDGSWPAAGQERYWVTAISGQSDTAFALLFLARGNAPIVLNKLEYGTAAPAAPGANNTRQGAKTTPAAAAADVGAWNRRPRDAANVTRWLGQQLERDLNWQTVNLQAPPEDLHDAPILYLAGTTPPVFDDAQCDKLRTFVQQGGLILGNADCGNPNFTKAFKTLGTKLFPDFEFRELPADHPIYQQSFTKKNAKRKNSLLGLSNGSRELLLLSQADPSRSWQLREAKSKPEMFELLGNIFLYVSDDKQLKRRTDTTWITIKPEARSKTAIKIARLQYPGVWDPEPAGWQRLDAVMNQRDKKSLDVQPIKLGDGKLDKSFAVAHLTGTQAFKLNDAARAELKTYVEGGGTLVIDSTGGASPFAIAAESELAAIWPSGKPAVVAPEHAVYAKPQPMEPVQWRQFARKKVGSVRTPQVKGVEINSRLAVFLSAEDLSTGLVGQPVDGVIGYAPESATDIMERVILYASAGNAK